MALPVEKTSSSRWHYVFEAALSFGQDVDVIGQFIHALDAHQAWQSEPERAADYGVRRLLAALAETGELPFPFEISAFPIRDQFADYAISGGQTRNVRLWVAGDPASDQSLLTHAMQSLEEVSDSVVFVDRDGPSVGSSISEIVGGSGGQSPGRGRTVGGLHLLTTREARLFWQTSRQIAVPLNKLYATDFFGWLSNQSLKLEEIENCEIDSVNLSEEVADMAKREKRQAQSYLENILLHLLKWEVQTGFRSSSWKTSIENAREHLHERLSESRQLYASLESDFERVYKRARRRAMQETGLSGDWFPSESPYAFKNALDPEFLPEADRPSWAPGSDKESDQ
jgi:hypothetical protein